VKRAYITGDLAKGKDANEINLFLIGTELDLVYLDHLINKTKHLIHRDITCTLLDESQEGQFLKENGDAFLIWSIKC
jgi:hypothetical protein